MSILKHRVKFEKISPGRERQPCCSDQLGRKSRVRIQIPGSSDWSVSLRKHKELMLKLKLYYFGHLMWRADSFEKTLMLGKIEGRRRRNDRGWDGWMASLAQWTWVWVDCGSWWSGRPGVLHGVTRSQTQLSVWTELNWKKWMSLTFGCSDTLLLRRSEDDSSEVYLFRMFLRSRSPVIKSYVDCWCRAEKECEPNIRREWKRRWKRDPS